MDDLNAKLHDLEKNSALHSAEISSLKDRVSIHGQQIDKLSREVISISVLLERIDMNVRKITTKLEDLSERPAEKWDRITWLIIAMVVSAVVTLVLSRIGIVAD